MPKAHEAMRAKAKAIPLGLIVAKAYHVPGMATTHEATIGKRMREQERAATIRQGGTPGGLPVMAVQAKTKNEAKAARQQTLATRMLAALAAAGGEARRETDWVRRHLHTAPQSVHAACDQLRQRGLIDIEPPPGKKRRACLLRLTDAGWQAAREAA